jgi:leucyl aminopeptidase
MNLDLFQGEIQQFQADTIIINLFKGVMQPGGATGAVDRALNGAISELALSGDLTGSAGEVTVVYPRGAIPATRVLVTGLGDRDSFDLEATRKAAASAIRRARKLNAKRVASIVHGAGIAGLPVEAASQATVEGMLLALYSYEAAGRTVKRKGEIDSITIVEFDGQKLVEIETGMRAAEAISAGASVARDLVNMPPNVATPSRMAAVAKEICDANGLNLIVGGREWAAERGMGAFLAVAKGAGEPPKFIIMEHNADRAELDTIVLVGKGITFDTGGISIKPTAGMGAMKSDMGGAAAVIGAMRAIASLDLPLRVVGIAPCTENMPDANAYRPADVITASNGKTIEIVSTDAEGRMVLADGLVYAANFEPKAVVDLATLTGACVTALGEGIAAGVFSNADELRDRLQSAGDRSHERVWPLPLWDDYKKSIKSDVADVKNSGGRGSGVGSSAIFLKEFIDFPWAHLDIAGMALASKATAYTPAGGTGFGVRLLVEFLRNW